MDFDENVEDLGDNLDGLNFNGDDILLMEEEMGAQYKSMKDCVIFLIDCNRTMLANNAVGQVLQVAESFLKTKIITNEKDLFGLVFYNIDETKNNLNFKGINVKIDLAQPDAPLIKNLKIISQSLNPALNKDYLNFIKTEFPPLDTEVTVNNALWICHSELKNFDAKNYNRRIFLFTDNDSPMNSNISDRNITIQRAKDMLESEIIIELFPMNFNTPFDMKKFYAEIIPTTVDSNEDLILTKENCEDRIRELSKRIRQKEVKKRTLGKCQFFLTKDVKFVVNFYATLKKATKLKSFNVDARNNKTLNTISQSLCKETAGILYPNQINTFQPYGGIKVPFTRDEMKQIKTLDSPGIKLMGFKSMDSIKPYYNIRESYFLYPDEYLTNGASQLCDALIKQLINKNRVAIVKFIPREGANMRFCALIPQKESFDQDYFQTPPGFNLIFLPYADEIRSTEDILKKVKNLENVENKITDEQRNAAKKLIKKMNIEFDARNFESPSIQKFFATLQALALGEDNMEPIEDLLNPDNEALRKVVDGCDENFKQLFYGNTDKTYKPVVKADKKVAKKRKAGDSDSEVSEVSEVYAKKGKKRNKKNDTASVNSEEEDSDHKSKKSKPKRRKTDMEDIDEEEIVPKKTPSKSKRKKSDMEDFDEEVEKIVPKKTASNSKQQNSRSKKNNIAIPDEEEYSDINLLKMVEDGSLEDLTVQQLKNICTLKNVIIKPKDLKYDIIQKISEFLFSLIK